ncbi:inverse autotransporter beta domain-containing protein [Hafnia paralvei]|uniref:inverse autotransporter beta domain-containing protein n=1 Tax=Hafnia paralvei TaxID=546367 RepID=UPI0038CF4916
MKFTQSPLARCLTWALVSSQLITPTAIATATLPSLNRHLDNSTSVETEKPDLASAKQQQDLWLANTAATIGGQLQEGDLSEYAKNQIVAYPESLANDAINKSITSFFPQAQFRGGIQLEDGTQFRSAEADVLLPLMQNTSSLIFGQLGLRAHDNNSFDGRTFVNLGVGYRRDVGPWLFGMNTFLDGDVKYNHLRGSIGLEAFRNTLTFSSNYYFPLTNWKTSEVRDLHDERPATGFDLRAKGSLPSLPWFGAEIAYEQYFGDKVDVLGNETLSSDPNAISGAIILRPVPLIEVRAGYKDAGDGGSQAEGGINLNYIFGMPLSAQLDPSRVLSANNSANKTAFVDRNYNIVMEYREQKSKISVHAIPINGIAGQTVTLHAGVSSRYPIEKLEWLGDAELLAGLKAQGNLNSPLLLPELPLTIAANKEYALYLKVTDSKGNSVTSERIPVTVTVNPESFRSHINVIHENVRHENGVFILPSPEVNDTEGAVIEWHYIRERSKDEWITLKPENVKYSSDSAGLQFTPLGGEERDGHWIERVKVNVYETQSRAKLSPVDLHISASGPNGIHPISGTIRMTPEVDLIKKINMLEVLFTPGTDELNGSTVAPVVGSELQARATCEDNIDCTSIFTYQWEISADGQRWDSILGANKAKWVMPPMLNGQSLQNKKVRVKVTAEAGGSYMQ